MNRAGAVAVERRLDGVADRQVRRIYGASLNRTRQSADELGQACGRRLDGGGLVMLAAFGFSLDSATFLRLVAATYHERPTPPALEDGAL